jgi:ferrous iron transport protein A
MLLSDCKTGKKMKVQELKLSESFRRRLMDLGLMPGVEIEVVRIAPFGDPMVVSFRGFQISFRRSVLSQIIVD